ncbi:hypothetical protein EIP91_008241 [Steccherinum ochraceum]|uniref:Uncharacterized protein n=1 Tax=Steccherinum ochraceum TaxID=92696 RepID=A0A4V2MVA0_9APHY|nr:hypothetical protein EIP91_008241 [Steccherinum ochraceum]
MTMRLALMNHLQRFRNGRCGDKVSRKEMEAIETGVNIPTGCGSLGSLSAVENRAYGWNAGLETMMNGYGGIVDEVEGDVEGDASFKTHSDDMREKQKSNGYVDRGPREYGAPTTSSTTAYQSSSVIKSFSRQLANSLLSQDEGYVESPDNPCQVHEKPWIQRLREPRLKIALWNVDGCSYRAESKIMEHAEFRELDITGELGLSILGTPKLLKNKVKQASPASVDHPNLLGPQPPFISEPNPIFGYSVSYPPASPSDAMQLLSHSNSLTLSLVADLELDERIALSGPRSLPLGRDAEGRVYYALTPSVSEYEAAKEAVTRKGSGKMKLKGKQGGFGVEERQEM